MLDSRCSHSSKFPSLSCACSRLSTFETLHSSEIEDEQRVREVQGRERGREGDAEGRKEGERKGRREGKRNRGRWRGWREWKGGREAKKALGVIPLCN